jgi:hypothetical protein
MTDAQDWTARVRAAASDVYTPEGVEIWMRSRNRLLDGRSPEQAIADGDGDRVYELVRALVDGAFA